MNGNSSSSVINGYENGLDEHERMQQDEDFLRRARNNQNGFKQPNSSELSKLISVSAVNGGLNTSSIHIAHNHNETNPVTTNSSNSGVGMNVNSNNGNSSSAGNGNAPNETSSNNQNNNNNSNENSNNNNSNEFGGSNNPTRVFSSGQKDILRLIGQHLRYLGLNKTTEMLVSESDCVLEHPIAANFCQLIMNGSWEEAETTLNSLKSIMDDSNNNIKSMRFLILEQKYLEFLEDGKILEALNCLRDELEPLKFNTDRLHELSSFLMCADRMYLKTLSKWAGKNDLSRQNLMQKLQKYLPPNIMLPAHRLEILLYQAIEYQCEKCSYHNYKDKSSIDDWSFLRDHICSKDDFPSISLQVLNDHCDEVWFCEFSNNGKRLASGSKDGCLIIWDVDPNTYKLTLNKAYDDHVCGVAFVAWSPDDRYVIVCGTEECSELWIWDVDNKSLKKRINNSHDDSLTCAAWMPDGQNFAAGGIKGQFYICDLEGNVKETWEGVRIRSLQTLPDGVVLAADNLKRIRSYNFKEMTDSYLIQEDFQIMSMTLNKASTHMLISVAAQGLHLWDVKDKVLVQKFQGSVQNNFINYSTFGGPNEIYVAGGSEDNRVYIWNARKEAPIHVLEGHTRSVTSVTWNPEIPGMIASASDDGTLRVWGPKNKSQLSSLSPNSANLECIFNSNHYSDQPLGDRNASNRAIDLTRQTSTNFRSDRSTPV